MSDTEALRWRWWMAPARLVGRVRPALLASARADAWVLGRMPGFVGTVVIPLVVIGIAAGFAASHAFAGPLPIVSPQVDWLRIRIDFIYTEAPLFLLATCVIGAVSPAAGVLFVLSFGLFDLAASTTASNPGELLTSAVHPVPFVARLVAFWLLWLLAVEVPVVGRVLASSTRRLAGSRVAMAAISAIFTGGFTFLWTQAAVVLIRPVFLWAHLPGIPDEAIQPLQTGGLVFAFVAGLTAAAVVLQRGPGRLLYPVPIGSGSSQRPRWLELGVAAVRRLLVAGLLTVGLAGIIITWLDAAVLFIAIAGAQPVSRLIARRTPIGPVMQRLPVAARVAIAFVLVLGVSWVTSAAGGPTYNPRPFSEFFSVIATFAMGLFVFELVVSSGPSRADRTFSMTQAASAGVVLGLALVAITGGAPLPVLANNCDSLSDCWNTVQALALAAATLPALIYAASRDWFADNKDVFNDFMAGQPKADRLAEARAVGQVNKKIAERAAEQAADQEASERAAERAGRDHPGR